jgi:O-antigen ligase
MRALISKLVEIARVQAFSVLAFSIFGLMFVMRPITWLPTIIILLTTTVVVSSTDLRHRAIALARHGDLRWIVSSFVAWFVACLFLGLWHLGFAHKFFPENPFRMFLALSALLLTVQAMSKRLWIAGLCVASVCLVLNVIYGHAVFDKYFPRISGTTNHPIHFGNFAAITAMLLMSLAMLGRSESLRFRSFCVVGALMALGSAVASQSRSSFVVLVCLVPLAFLGLKDQLHRWLVRVGMALTVVALVVVATNPIVQEKLRIKETGNDIELIESNNYKGSIGSRLSMWQTAWSMFKDHPFLGIGPNKFQSEFARRMESGESPRADAEHNQPHSDLLNAASTGGLLKLMAYVFLIAAPFMFFHKKYKVNQQDVNQRMLPIMGMQIVAAYFLTGLTNSHFDIQIYSTTFAVVVCVLAQLILFDQQVSGRSASN